MTTKKLVEEITDNIFFRMAWVNMKNKRIPLTVPNLFNEAYRLLNFTEKHHIKLGEK